MADERRAAAARELREAECRKRNAERDFSEYALLTYPRPNENADEFAGLAREAELDMRYWQGALDALRGALSIDIADDGDGE